MAKEVINPDTASDLFQRVGKIVEQAQASTVRAVNINIVTAYWRGFFNATLLYFNQFYQTYLARKPCITYLPDRASQQVDSIPYPAGREFNVGFNPTLSWSHYRDFMRVQNPAARDFYEIEAVAKDSVLNEYKQIFASRYLHYLPSETELQQEMDRERQAIEAGLEERKGEQGVDDV